MTDRRGRPHAPFRLDLDQQRKRAKELLRLVRAGDPAALARFRAHHPAASSNCVRDLARLSEAQLVIARELGCPSWTKLKAHIEGMDEARCVMTRRDSPLDGELATLHIRCGSDIRPALQEAGFSGDFLEYSNPLCQGPVTNDPDLLSLRARFIVESAGARHMGLSIPEVRHGLARAEQRLAEAARRYERVVMWFEHDSYDQLILARCLAQFAVEAPPMLELVSINHFPGASRFIGLGQLPPEAFRVLWQRRRPVRSDDIAMGLCTWEALKSPDPTALSGIMRSGTPELPDLAGALQRHLQELPATRSGLSLTQHLVLGIVHDENRTVGRVFHELMTYRDPRPWLGDLMLLSMVEEMQQISQPVFTVERQGETPFQHRLALTETGRAVLLGQCDWLSLGPPERWVGGVAIRAPGPCWRWDTDLNQPVFG